MNRFLVQTIITKSVSELIFCKGNKVMYTVYYKVFPTSYMLMGRVLRVMFNAINSPASVAQ